MVVFGGEKRYNYSMKMRECSLDVALFNLGKINILFFF